MPVTFREERATQAAARLLKLRGGQMSYLKLLKLLYLADREALRKLGRPISYDRYCSMKQGPVLSRTYDLVMYEYGPDEEPSYWRQLISFPQNYEVKLLRDPPPRDQLSAADETILDAIFKEWGHKSRWDLVEYTHNLPEYKKTDGPSIPIGFGDVLRGLEIPEDDAKAIIQEMWAADHAKQLLG